MIQVPFDMATAKAIADGKKFGYIKTRDGFQVHIYDWDVNNRYCIAGKVMLDGDEYVRQWTKEGKGDIRPNVTMRSDLILEVEGGEG